MKKIYKAVDKSIRFAIYKRGNYFVKKLGIMSNISSVVNTKAFNADFDEREMDALVDLEDGYSLIIEIQTTKIGFKKLKSMIEYILYVKEQYNKNVRFGLIYASDDKGIVEYELIVCDELVLKPIVYTFAEEDGDKTLNNLKTKIENNEILTEEDINHLSVISLYPTKKSPEILAEESAKLVVKINNLPQADIESIIYIQLMLINKRVKTKEKRKKIIRCLKMKSESIIQEIQDMGKEEWIKEGIKIGVEEGKEKGIKEGKEEGIKEGKEEGIKEGKEEGIKEERKSFIKKLKSKGLDAKEISNLTDLPIETITTLLKF